MDKKTIIIIVLAVAVLLLGGWLVFKGKAPAAQQQAQQQAQPEVQGQDVTVGTGTQATPGTIVSVLYTGKLSDGTVFDSSATHNNEPLTFQLGAKGLIPGFQIGVNGMKEGGERTIVIPPELGYGENAIHQNPQDPNSPILIPAHSTLIFDVKLVKVQAMTAGTTTAPTSPAKKAQ